MANVPQKIMAMLRNAGSNPQEIGDAVLQIIETPAGQRQLRYRVGPRGPGVQRINAVTDEIQAQMLEAFGLTEPTTFKSYEGKTD
jgi:hypothetical protein